MTIVFGSDEAQEVLRRDFMRRNHGDDPTRNRASMGGLPLPRYIPAWREDDERDGEEEEEEEEEWQ